MSLGIILDVEDNSFELDICKSTSPLETLSPTFIPIDSILPEKIDGISTLDLSLSIVTTGSFIVIS